MTLCPNCHSIATMGAMPEAAQREYKRHPRNIRRRFAEGMLHVDQDYCAISIGDNQFVGDGSFVQVDGQSLLALHLSDEGELEISLALHDQNDNLLLLIENNEWITGDPSPWDIEFKYRYLKLRRRRRDIALELDARQNPIEIRADLWKSGQNIKLGPRELLINGVVNEFRMHHLCLVAMSVSIDTELEIAQIQPDPRFGSGILISWPDVPERLRRGRDAWLQLKSRSGTSP